MQKHKLADENIAKLLLEISLPATVAMMVIAFYNIADTIFIGRGVGTAGIAAVTVSFPINLIVLALGQLIGVGASSLVSRLLGANKPELAVKTVGNAYLCSTVISVLFTAFGLIFSTDILRLFGATPQIIAPAKEYLDIILLGSPFFIFAMVSNNLLRSEGKAKIAMSSMLTSALLNIVLDYIFIFIFHWGIKGAAWATIISQAVTVVYLNIYFKLGNSIIKIDPKNFGLNGFILKEIFSVGVSAFVMQIAQSVMQIVLNRLLAAYGEMYLAIGGIVNRLLSFFFMPLIGLSQGLQPIAGYNYGAKNYAKTRKAFFLAVKFGTYFSLVGFVFIELFPRLPIMLFSADPIVIEKGGAILRIIMMGYPLAGFQIPAANIFTALGKAGEALLLYISRQLVLIPLLLLCSSLFAEKGLWVAFPVSDLIMLCITIFLLSRVKDVFHKH